MHTDWYCKLDTSRLWSCQGWSQTTGSLQQRKSGGQKLPAMLKNSEKRRFVQRKFLGGVVLVGTCFTVIYKGAADSVMRGAAASLAVLQPPPHLLGGGPARHRFFWNAFVALKSQELTSRMKSALDSDFLNAWEWPSTGCDDHQEFIAPLKKFAAKIGLRQELFKEKEYIYVPCLNFIWFHSTALFQVLPSLSLQLFWNVLGAFSVLSVFSSKGIF